MTILQSELKLFKARTIVDGPTNGGNRSYDEVESGVAQSNFPHVFQSQLTAGDTIIRFNYAANHSANNESAFNMRVWLDNPTPGGDYVYFVPVSHGDTQGDLTGSETKYVCAALQTDVSSGGSSIIVTCEHADLTGSFVDTAEIRITDMEYPDSGTGNQEYHVINGTPSVNGAQVTMSITGTLANSYTVAAGTRVSVIYKPGTVETSSDTYTKTTTSGTYDEATYPVVLTNVDTVEETWTVTFSDATTFTVAGSWIGSVGGGTTGSDFEPTNPDTGDPYFSLPSAGWGGTWANTETLSFKTYDSSVAVAQYEIVPAATSSLSGNRATIVMSCESA